MISRENKRARERKSDYCLSNKSYPISYSKMLHKLGQDFLDRQYAPLSPVLVGEGLPLHGQVLLLLDALLLLHHAANSYLFREAAKTALFF